MPLFTLDLLKLIHQQLILQTFPKYLPCLRPELLKLKCREESLESHAEKPDSEAHAQGLWSRKVPRACPGNVPQWHPLVILLCSFETLFWGSSFKRFVRCEKGPSKQVPCILMTSAVGCPPRCQDQCLEDFQRSPMETWRKKLYFCLGLEQNFTGLVARIYETSLPNFPRAFSRDWQGNIRQALRD